MNKGEALKYLHGLDNLYDRNDGEIVSSWQSEQYRAAIECLEEDAVKINVNHKLSSYDSMVFGAWFVIGAGAALCWIGFVVYAWRVMKGWWG